MQEIPVKQESRARIVAGPIVLVAHDDSVPVSYCGNGDSACAPTLLEHRVPRRIGSFPRGLAAGGAGAFFAVLLGLALPPAVFADHVSLLFHAPPSGGLTFTVMLNAAERVRVRVMDGSDGLDGLPGFTPRPEGMGIMGSPTSGPVLVAKIYTV